MFQVVQDFSPFLLLHTGVLRCMRNGWLGNMGISFPFCKSLVPGHSYIIIVPSLKNDAVVVMNSFLLICWWLQRKTDRGRKQAGYYSSCSQGLQGPPKWHCWNVWEMGCKILSAIFLHFYLYSCCINWAVFLCSGRKSIIIYFNIYSAQRTICTYSLRQRASRHMELSESVCSESRLCFTSLHKHRGLCMAEQCMVTW